MSKSVKNCGSLYCQRDSYARSLNSVIVSCQPTALNGANHNYELVLEDTILFPEGGGQPDDYGTLNGISVKRVLRKGGKAVHIADAPLKPGTLVDVQLDWSRRFDHMQQHSGQHLITAVADREFGIKTLSWNLAIGEKNLCFVQLDTPNLSRQQMSKIEGICNELVRQGVPMTPHWYPPSAPELEGVRCRGLPDDFEGEEVRVVEIEGLDSNMCCGTHVSSLSHLQCVKLVSTSSKKGSTFLHYIVGNRVLVYASKAIENEVELNKLLSVSQEEHPDAVAKILKANKSLAKEARTHLREIAQLLAFKHHNTMPFDPVACVHREDGEPEFMNTLANELATKCTLVLVTVGGDKNGGHFLLAGSDEAVGKIGPQVALLFEAKGGGRKGRFQGKASRLDKRKEAEKLLRDYHQSTSQPL